MSSPLIETDSVIPADIGQSQFAPLKLRSLALVPSSVALPRPCELHLWQLHCKTLPSAPSAPVRDLRSFRAPTPPVLVRGVSERKYAVPVRLPVPESGQPAAGLSPPGAAGAFPPIKGKRSQDCAGTSPPQTCAGSSPTAPRGQKRPGAAVPARPSLPQIRED